MFFLSIKPLEPQLDSRLGKWEGIYVFYIKKQNQKRPLLLMPTWQKTNSRLKFYKLLYFCHTKWYSESFWPIDVFSSTKQVVAALWEQPSALGPQASSQNHCKVWGHGVLDRKRSLEEEVGGAQSWPAPPPFSSVLLALSCCALPLPSCWPCPLWQLPSHVPLLCQAVASIFGAWALVPI